MVLMLLLFYYGAGEAVAEVIPTVFLYGLVTAFMAVASVSSRNPLSADGSIASFDVVASIDSHDTTGVIFIAPPDKGKVSGTA